VLVVALTTRQRRRGRYALRSSVARRVIGSAQLVMPWRERAPALESHSEIRLKAPFTIPPERRAPTLG